MAKTAPKPRLNLPALRNQNVREAYQDALTGLPDTAPQPGPDVTPESLSTSWNNACSTLLDVAQDSLGTAPRRHRDWFDEHSGEIRAVIRGKNAAHDAYLRNPSASNKEKFTAMRSTGQLELRAMENTWWTKLANEMQGHMDSGDLHNFHSALKAAYGPTCSKISPIRSADGNTLLTDLSKILDRWAEHFQQLLNQANPTDPTFLDSIPQLTIVEELDQVPTYLEVEKAIWSLKNHKAAGPDGIPAELLKYGGDNTIRYLHKLYQCCWESGQVPQHFKDGKIITIYKNKGDKTICGNSRGVTLLSNAGKGLARVMLTRLIHHVSENILPESQCGFRREQSTVDMIFVIRQLQEKCKE